MKSILLLTLTFLIAINAKAVTVANGDASVQAKVTGFGTYGNGVTFVFFAPLDPTKKITNCSNDVTWANRFDITPASPGYKTFMTTITTAMALDKVVVIHPSECQDNKVIWKNDGSSYVILSN